MESDRKEAGLHCLTCGRWEMPPNRKLDNWSCNYCFSGFLSVAMLTNLIPRNVLADILDTSRSREVSRECILCAKPMHLVRLSKNENEIEVEVCRRCKICWFNGGALVRFTRVLAPEQLQKLKTAIELPLRGVRAPAAHNEAANIKKTKASRIPIATIGIFVLSTVFTGIGARKPEWAGWYGFSPSEPFQANGLTFFTSLFFNTGYQLHAAFLFLFVGSYAERKMGWLNLFLLFMLAGALSRLSYLFLPSDSQLVTGGGPGIAGVVVFVLLGLPYMSYLYPAQRWKSPRATLGWLGVIALMFFFVFFVLDLATQSLVGMSNGHIEYVLPGYGKMPSQAQWWAYIVGALTGLLWRLAETFSTASSQSQ
jgi:hypothetical protein